METKRTSQIQDDQGRFYAGAGHWTQEDIAYTYTTTDELPAFIDARDGRTLEKEVHADGHDVDIRYYAEGQEEGVASVRVTVEETFDEDEAEAESNFPARILFPDDCSHAYRAKLKAAAIRLDYQIEWFDDPAACESAGGETPNANRIYAELCEFVGSEND